MNPDHCALIGAAWSGFIVFAAAYAAMSKTVWSAFEYMQQTYLSQDLHLASWGAEKPD